MTFPGGRLSALVAGVRRKRAIASALLLLPFAALLFLDLRHGPPRDGPKLLARQEGHGALLAGAAKSEIRIPFPVVTAGYGPKDRVEVRAAAQPQYARALSLQVGEARLTLVSVDLLEVDSSLLADAQPRLSNSAGQVWLCATHTHSGLGDYDPNLLAQLAGTGRYRSEVREALLAAISDAVQKASSARAESLVRELRLDRRELVSDRSHSGDEPDGSLEILAVGAPGRIATLFAFGAHPTLVPRRPGAVDGDFPARLTAAIDAAPGALGLFFQGPVGNQSVATGALPSGVDPMDGLRERLLPRAGEDSHWLPISDARVATVSVELPETELRAGPAWTRRASSNLVDRLVAPRTTELSVARLGDLTLVAVPGEPTAAAAHTLREAVGDPAAVLLSLCNGYVGYIESPDRVAKGEGEAPRQYFDASLLEHLAQGAQAASRALGSAPPTAVGTATSGASGPSP